MLQRDRRGIDYPYQDLQMIARTSFALSLAVTICLAATATAGAQELAPASAAAERATVEAISVPTAAPAPRAEAPTVAGPTMQSASVAARPVASDARALPAPDVPRRNSMGQPVALMAVGAAALIGGSLAGGNAGHVIAVGGLIVGLYGLYLYLQ